MQRTAKPLRALSAAEAGIRTGDLVLLGSRPGQGKTLLSLGLAIETIRLGNQAAFFTLYFSQADIAACFKKIEIV